MTLVEFLFARITEDEAKVEGIGQGDDPDFFWGPDRIRAECAAKRRIIELHNGHHECVGVQNGDPLSTVLVSPGYRFEDDPTLCLLAAPYADHADFDADWGVA